MGWPDQEVINADLVEKKERPYFSLLLIRRNSPQDVIEKDY